MFIVTFLASQGLFAYVLVSKYSCSGESCFSNEGKQRHLSPESLSKVHGRTGEDIHGFMQEAPKNKVFDFILNLSFFQLIQPAIS